MTRTEFFHMAAISIACEAFKDYPSYGTEDEIDEGLKERFVIDPKDPIDREIYSKGNVWTSRVVWAAEKLTNFIEENWQTFDPE